MWYQKKAIAQNKNVKKSQLPNFFLWFYFSTQVSCDLPIWLDAQLQANKAKEKSKKHFQKLSKQCL